MRNLLIIVVVAFLATACGTSKQVVNQANNNAPKKVKLEKEECQVKAEKSSEFLRAYGIGTSFDQMFARDIAALVARNEIAMSVKASVSSLLSKYVGHRSLSGEEGLTRDESDKIQEKINGLTDEILKGSRIICSNIYQIGTEYEYHVCIELTNIDLAQRIDNKLTSDEKLMIDFEADKFGKELKTEIEDYRKRKQQAL